MFHIFDSCFVLTRSGPLLVVPVRPKRKYGTQFLLFPVASVWAPRTGDTSEDGIREKPFSKEPTRAASECPRLLRIVLITAAYPTMGTPTRPNRGKPPPVTLRTDQ
jgi:hypothetical protein